MNERLVAFINDMISYHAPPKSIEHGVGKAEYTAPDDDPPDPFEQDHIELYARQLVARLEGTND